MFWVVYDSTSEENLFVFLHCTMCVGAAARHVLNEPDIHGSFAKLECMKNESR